jgi:hypothetical protein
MKDKTNYIIGNKIENKTCSVCGQKGHQARCHWEPPKERKCSKCQEIKPIERFSKYTPNKIGLIRYLSECKDCVNTRTRNRYVNSIDYRLKSLFWGAKETIKRREGNKAIINITMEDVFEQFKKQNGKCYYTNLELIPQKGWYSISLDRLDSAKGYIKGNIVICCWVINNMKSDINYNKFIEFCGLVYNNHKNKLSN